jgi:hypothetical protein
MVQGIVGIGPDLHLEFFSEGNLMPQSKIGLGLREAANGIPRQVALKTVRIAKGVFV